MPFMPPMGDHPPIIRELITLGGKLPAGVDMSLVTQFGQNIIHNMSGQISHFLLSQRQNHRLSGYEVTRTQRSIPPLELMYESLHGREALTINCTVTPKMLLETVFTEDINLDGYFAFFYDAKYVPGKAGVDLYMNGKKFHTAIIPTGVSCGTIICAFGKTALKCHSLNDDSNPNKGSGKLFPPVSPTLSKINGVPQLPGYFALNWADPRSPIGDPFSSPGSDAARLAAMPGQAGFQVFYCDTKAPTTPDPANPIIVVPSFDPKGPNLFEAFILGTVGSANILNGGCFAEFFDRTKKRYVSQSWNKLDTSGSATILVNDTPMYNGDGGYADASRNVGVYVDLSLKPDPPLTGIPDAENALAKIAGIQSRLSSHANLSTNEIVQNRTLSLPTDGRPLPIPGSYSGPEYNYRVSLDRPTDASDAQFPPPGGEAPPNSTIQYVQAYQYSLVWFPGPDPRYPGQPYGHAESVATPIPGKTWAILVPNGMTVEQAELQSRYRLLGYGT